MIYRRMFGFPMAGLRDAFSELDRMRRQMDRLYEGMGTGAAGQLSAGVFPLVNLTEDKDNFYIRAELPGIKAKDIDIQAAGNNISISGERKISAENQNANAKYHRRERDAGKFSRVIGLPNDIKSDGVDAKLENGILILTVPKAEAAKPRQITVS